MIEDIRKRIERVPFQPFWIRTSEGHEYSVPTVDHVWLPPSGNRVAVADDGGIVNVLRPIHISSLRERKDGKV